MGVDAIVFAKLPRRVEDVEIVRLRRALCGAFGASKFSIDRSDGIETPPPIGRLDYGKPASNQHICNRGDDETVVEVNIWMRYYGIGYERGDLPFLLTLCKFLLDWFDGEAVVHYGADCNDEQPPMTEERANELWAHFVRHQCEPYYLNDRPEGIRCFCGFCGGAEMNRHGWGAGYGVFRCWSCGLSKTTKDGGITWEATNG